MTLFMEVMYGTTVSYIISSHLTVDSVTNESKRPDGTYYFPDYYVKTGYSGLDPNLPVSDCCAKCEIVYTES